MPRPGIGAVRVALAALLAGMLAFAPGGSWRRGPGTAPPWRKAAQPWRGWPPLRWSWTAGSAPCPGRACCPEARSAPRSSTTTPRRRRRRGITAARRFPNRPASRTRSRPTRRQGSGTRALRVETAALRGHCPRPRHRPPRGRAAPREHGAEARRPQPARSRADRAGHRARAARAAPQPGRRGSDRRPAHDGQRLDHNVRNASLPTRLSAGRATVPAPWPAGFMNIQGTGVLCSLLPEVVQELGHATNASPRARRSRGGGGRAALELHSGETRARGRGRCFPARRPRGRGLRRRGRGGLARAGQEADGA